jgi:RNA polymerase sigma-70 factor (ECF subfamily)
VDQRTDEQVLESYRRGEAAALEVLIRRHHDDLLRFLYRLTGSRTLAEDVFQETFLQIHLSAGTFDVTRRFKPWLFTIAANKARDMLRKNARRRTLDLDAPVGGGASGGGGGGSGGGEVTFIDLMEIDGLTPAEGVLDAERDAKVQQVVSELPLLMREILLLAYFQRMSYSQIAEALDIPLGTVKSRLHSAVAAFAKKWQGVNKDE